jgi:hypothetical protein
MCNQSKKSGQAKTRKTKTPPKGGVYAEKPVF